MMSSIQAILDILSALDMSEVHMGCTIERVAIEGCWFQGDCRVAQSQSPSQVLRYEKLINAINKKILKLDGLIWIMTGTCAFFRTNIVMAELNSEVNEP